MLAVEPAACPSLTQGTYAYDFGDTAGMTPLMKMHTLGHDFVPDPIHAGGLRYHGMSPLISHLYETGEIEAVAKPQTECFSAGVLFARTEGIVPAPEPTHALAAAVEEAVRCKETGEEKVILTALCGHGHLDLAAYDAYLSGNVVDHEWERRRHPGRRWPTRSPGSRCWPRRRASEGFDQQRGAVPGDAREHQRRGQVATAARAAAGALRGSPTTPRFLIVSEPTPRSRRAAFSCFSR